MRDRVTRLTGDQNWKWALRIAARRGKRIAAVALARKLAGILFAMTQHGRDFDPERMRRAPAPAAAA